MRAVASTQRAEGDNTESIQGCIDPARKWSRWTSRGAERETGPALTAGRVHMAGSSNRETAVGLLVAGLVRIVGGLGLEGSASAADQLDHTGPMSC